MIQDVTEQVVTTKLPCGGRIITTFQEFRPSTRKGNIEVGPFPVIKCPRSYDETKGCPWLERLRKFYCGTVDLDVRTRNGNASRCGHEAKVLDFNGRGTVVVKAQDCGIVVRGVEEFSDQQLPLKLYDEPEDFFYCSNNVNAKHGGIIAFFKRLFGRRVEKGER